MDIRSLMQPHIQDLEPYAPPDWEDLAAHVGIRPDQLIRLDANESPYGPSPRVARALARFEGFGFYPDYRALTTALSRYTGVAPENVILGNGGDEIIDLVVRLFVAPGEGVLVCPPSFGMYAVSATAHRGRVLPIPRRPDFSVDLEAIETLVADPTAEVRPKVLFVASPGNPDGRAIPLEAIQRLLRLPLALVVDEAYIEFGGESAMQLLDAHANLIVLRTFSKWAGMAGLRLGYALTTPEIASAMARLRLPYNVNAAAIVAAQATLSNLDHVQATIARIVAERERLFEALAQIPGADPIPSQANFVLFHLRDHTGREMADALARQGILVRSFSDPLLVDTLRVTVGRPSQNDAFLAALEHALGGTPNVQRSVPNRAGDGSGTNQTPTRSARIHRQTGETEVTVTLDLDGSGDHDVDTGLGFLDHMLAQVAAHGLFDLVVEAQGDLQVDEHHTVEDVAIGLGQSLDQALGDRRGVVRMGHAYAPLDEALARVVVDLSGRPYAVIEAKFATPRIGAVGTDLLIHFLETIAAHARLSLHAQVLYGRNDHHKAEALFKALGRALDAATRLDPRHHSVPSTKGVL